jgi:hypothetical protein
MIEFFPSPSVSEVLLQAPAKTRGNIADLANARPGTSLALGKAIGLDV